MKETKNCDNCGQPNTNFSTQWCSQNCLWGKDKNFCQMCIGHHISDLEYHRQNCPIRNNHRKPNSSPNNNNNRERERERERDQKRIFLHQVRQHKISQLPIFLEL